VKPLVFISYAQLDEPDNPGPGEVRWLTFVMDFLRPGVKGRKFGVWIDRVMPGCADWNSEIEHRARTSNARLGQSRTFNGVGRHGLSRTDAPRPASGFALDVSPGTKHEKQ
jgi:hypothetical protein